MIGKLSNCNESWEKIHSQRAWSRYPNEELVRFIGRNYFKLPREKRQEVKVLEWGCGQGANLWFLVKEGFDVYGFDISQSAIEKGVEYLSREYNVKADLKVVDARKELPYKDGFFDIIIDCASIQHVSFKDHNKVYKEIHRILKSEGKFWSYHITNSSWGYGTGNLIDCETFDNLSEGLAANYGTICMPSEKNLKNLLLNNGFEINKIEKQSITYENQQKEISHWITEAAKQCLKNEQDTEN